jgi:hypothetical protein
MKIRAKIRLTMLAAFVIGMGLAAAGAYTILKRTRSQRASRMAGY